MAGNAVKICSAFNQTWITSQSCGFIVAEVAIEAGLILGAAPEVIVKVVGYPFVV